MDNLQTTKPRTTSRAMIAALLAGTLALSGAIAEEPRAGDGLASPEGEIILRVAGDITRTNASGEAHFDRAMIEAMPLTTLETTTVVTDGVKTFEGVLMRDLLDAVGAEGETVTAVALNDYAIDIPLEDFERYDVVAAFRMDGERLTPRDKGPLWIVYPRDDFDELQDIRYDYRWVWQLVRLEVR